MDKLFIRSIMPLLMLFLPLNQVFAECRVNGEIVPCDQFWSQFGWMFALIGIVSIIGSIFWIWMLIDCLKRDFKDKLVWVILMIIANLFGAVLYYLLVKRKDKSTVV